MDSKTFKKKKVDEAIKKYHKYSFKLKNVDVFDNIEKYELDKMEKYVNMFENLIDIIKNVEGVEYIDTFLNTKQYQKLNCSISNYYYRKNKINNILWKYLFDW